MMRHLKRGTGRAAVALVAAGAALAVLPAGTASAESPAIVGPLLQIFSFGADVGVPTGCQAASATMGSASAEAGLAQQAADAIAAINSGCETAQQKGDTYIARGNTYSAPLSVWNPVVNAVLQSSADSADQLSHDYGPALAPFGGTLSGVGATINFFQGK